MSETTSDVREIMPAPWRRPVVLLWLYMAPPLLLALLNLRSYSLVSGEMTPTQLHMAWTMAGYNLALMLAAGLAYAWARGRAGGLRWTLGAMLLPLQLGYLWMTVAWLDQLIPRSVPFWMLPPERVLYHQFALVMPGVFHAALLVACFPTRLRLRSDLARSLIVLMAIPAAWYVVVHLLTRAHRIALDIPSVVVFLLIALSTLVLMGALLRVLTAGWVGLRCIGGHGRLLLIALVGLAGPLGGLWLNAYIPFPVDFQSWAVYVLAAINGVVLLLPGNGSRAGHRLVWLAQCATFPFTLYFFVVFLPFLPLSLLAIVAMGAGFLMLVPTALALVHLTLLREGWQASGGASQSRGWRVAAVVLLLLLPGYFAGRAFQDKAALGQALDYLYEAKNDATRFPGDLKALDRSLQNLRDFKAGLQLPFLSEFYSQVVFGGLTLPEARVQEMYRAYFGVALESPDASRLTNPLFGQRRSNNFWGGIRTAPPWPHDVVVADLQTRAVTEEGVEKRTVTLQLANRGPDNSEYVAEVRLPAGCWITGFRLKVGDELVPGRLFEKKTALWVYEMIRDQTRRDPGLLVYRDPGTVELRVFPFATNETRTVEMEFMNPAGLSEPLHIGDRRVESSGGGGSHDAVARVQGTSPGALWVVGEEVYRKAPVEERSTYLHLVVDRSAGRADPALAWEAVQAMARELGVDRCRVTAANFELEDVVPESVPLAEVPALWSRVTLPVRGGFCRDRALAHVLRQANEQRPDEVALVVVLSSQTNTVALEAELAYLASAWPGQPGYVQLAPSGRWQTVDWSGNPLAWQRPVLWRRLALDGQSHWIPDEQKGPVVLLGDASADAVGNEVVHERYLQAARAWMLSHARWQRKGAALPSIRDLVEASRSAGVLIPATSYIVVENSAQWRFLEQSEKTKLQQNTALAFRDAPEPASWILALGFAACWCARNRRRAAKSPSV